MRTSVSLTVTLLLLGHCGTVAYNGAINMRGKGLHAFSAANHPGLADVKYLDLSDNFIIELTGTMFLNATKLRKLYLKNNAIERISWDTFETLRSLTILDLSDNNLEHIPNAIFRNLKNLKILYLDGNSLSRISSRAFSKLTSLQRLNIANNGLQDIAPGTFDSLDSLITLNLDDNKLNEIPEFNVTSSITLLSMTSNPVRKLESRILKRYAHLEKLYLSHTEIEYLQNDVFANNLKLYELHVAGPSLLRVDVDAFQGPKLHELNLEGSQITSLAVNGLEWITNLNIKNVHDLWQLPASSLFRLRHVLVTYSFHCCLLENTQMPTSFNGNYSTCPPIGTVDWTTHAPTTASRRAKSITSPTTAATNGIFHLFAGHFRKWMNKRTDTRQRSSPTVAGKSNRTVLLQSPNSSNTGAVHTLPPHVRCPGPTRGVELVYKSRKRYLKCLPAPDAFNPCENLMGDDGLHICVWFVLVFAILGNVLKLIVHFINRRTQTITRLLMCSLAFANLCMGVYLAMLAMEDLLTRSQYHNHIKSWQYGAGCRMAGFLSIFSSEMSTYTLTTITLERYYMVVFPLHKSKHLKLKDVAVATFIGWVLSLAVAILPLIGISSYEKVAICLPFDVTSAWDKAYVTFLLVKNIAAFLIMFQCYSRMYTSLVLGGAPCVGAIRLERRVAKRMGLLVFTNFACLFPISLLGLIAIYDESLIAVDTSKFLLVFIYPINAFTNPYLYALNTKKFKVDAIGLLISCGFCPTKLSKLQNRYRNPQTFDVAEHIQLQVRCSEAWSPRRRRPSVKFSIETYCTKVEIDYTDADESYSNCSRANVELFNINRVSRSAASRISAHAIFVRGSTISLSETFSEEGDQHSAGRTQKEAKLQHARSQSCTNLSQESFYQEYLNSKSVLSLPAK